jgi:hypothetical protein
MSDSNYTSEKERIADCDETINNIEQIISLTNRVLELRSYDEHGPYAVWTDSDNYTIVYPPEKKEMLVLERPTKPTIVEPSKPTEPVILNNNSALNNELKSINEDIEAWKKRNHKIMIFKKIGAFFVFVLVLILSIGLPVVDIVLLCHFANNNLLIILFCVLLVVAICLCFYGLKLSKAAFDEFSYIKKSDQIKPSLLRKREGVINSIKNNNNNRDKLMNQYKEKLANYEKKIEQNKQLESDYLKSVDEWQKMPQTNIERNEWNENEYPKLLKEYEEKMANNDQFLKAKDEERRKCEEKLEELPHYFRGQQSENVIYMNQILDILKENRAYSFKEAVNVLIDDQQKENEAEKENRRRDELEAEQEENRRHQRELEQEREREESRQRDLNRERDRQEQQERQRIIDDERREQQERQRDHDNQEREKRIAERNANRERIEAEQNASKRCLHCKYCNSCSIAAKRMAESCSRYYPS